MGKAFAATCRFLIILFIVGLVGYNTYEIGRLRAEIAALRGASGAAQTHSSGTMEQIAEARSHAERATTLIKQQKISAAAKEVQAASDAAARASGNVQAQSRRSVADAQESLAKLRSRTADLWRQAEAAAKTAGGTSPPATHEKHDEKQHNEK